jgi:hypothetical protein
MMAINEVGALINLDFVDPRQFGDALSIMKEFIQPV